MYIMTVKEKKLYSLTAFLRARFSPSIYTFLPHFTMLFYSLFEFLSLCVYLSLRYKSDRKYLDLIREKKNDSKIVKINREIIIPSLKTRSIPLTRSNQSYFNAAKVDTFLFRLPRDYLYPTPRRRKEGKLSWLPVETTIVRQLSGKFFQTNVGQP